MAPRMRIVLASSSPRRRQLLEEAGLVFELAASVAEELHDASMLPSALCEWNAKLKASDVANLYPDAHVIGADTLVFIDEIPLGKPKDFDEAREMLRRLSGRTHQVCTGVSIVTPSGAARSFHEISDVTFLALDDEAITDYFSCVNPLDKAGAYGIQEHGDKIISGITGAFDNVMGLPVARVMAVLGSYSLD